MDSRLKAQLSLLGIQVNSLNQFNDGIKLSELIVHKLYNDNNPQLLGRIKRTNLHQTANCIHNINNLLKDLKTKQECPEQIKTISVFKLLQEQKYMIQLLTWLVNLPQPQNNQNIDHIPESQNIQQKNDQLKNFYFASQLNNQNLPQQQYQLPPQEEIIKPGTVKIFKPKTVFNNSHSNHIVKNIQSQIDIIQKQPKKNTVLQLPRPYQNTPMPRFINANKIKPKKNNSLNHSENQINQQSIQQQRVQIVYYQDKPFVGSDRRNKNQNNNSNLKYDTLSNHSSRKSMRVEQMEKEVNKINKQIQLEKKSLTKIQKSTNSLRSLKSKSKPKSINASDIPDILKPIRKQIVQWLISINLLNSLAIKNYENLHLICKNGLIFPQIINYRKGREQQLKYERNPKKTTEIHSNYKRLFSYLQEFANFSSDLLFQYDLFIPQSTQKPFWALLNDIYNFYKGKTKRKSSVIIDQDQLNMHPIPKQTQRNYNNIKFGFDPKQTSIKKLNQQKSQKKLYTSSSDQYRQIMQKQSVPNQNKNTLNIDHQNINRSSIMESPSGYRLQYLKKLQTPKRRESINNTSHNSSMTKSRISLKNNSAKKNNHQLPLITLEMELVSLKYLKQNNYPIRLPKSFSQIQLFDDPIRNGTLLMLIICKCFNMKADFRIKPKSIQQCRQNYLTAFKIIKNCISTFPQNLLSLSQQIIKGQKNIFYGILYHIIINQDKKNISNYRSNLDDSCKLSSYDTNENQTENIMNWIQSLSNNNENIRMMKPKSWNQLLENIKTGLLLTQFARIITNKQIKPVHQKPQYTTQYQSNLNKALFILNQNKIIPQSYIWKIKKIISADEQVIINLLSHIKKQISPKPVDNIKPTQVSFNHLLRNNYNTLNTTFQNKPLQTTMNNYSTNNLTNQKPKQQQQISVIPEASDIQIQWMKKIGFTCSHRINNGVVLCRLLQKLTMKSIEGINYNPRSKGQMLLNIRKVLKQLNNYPKIFDFVDQNYIYEADEKATIRIYKGIKQAYKNSYVLKGLSSNKSRSKK